MYRSYRNGPIGSWRLLALALVAGVLVGCGSAPSKPEKAEAPADAAQPADPAAALPPEAVQKFDQAVVHMSAADAAAEEQGFLALASAYPSYSGPLLNLGILQVRAGRFAEAEQSLRSAIERNPDNAAAYNQLGITYRQKGEFVKAREAYEKSISLDASYGSPVLNLGILNDLYLQDRKRALVLYDQYLALSGGDAAVTKWVADLKNRKDHHVALNVKEKP